MRPNWTAGCAGRYTQATVRAARTFEGGRKMFQRKRYQFGWLRRKPRRRGPDVWVWVHRSEGPAGKSKENAVIVGNVAQYPTEAEAWRATEGLRLAINTTHRTEGVTFNAVIDRYLREKLPKRHSSASKYRSWLTHHIQPKWGSVPIRNPPAGRGMAVGARSRTQEQRSHPQHHAHLVQLGYEVGID